MSTIKTYISTCPEDHQEKLLQLYTLIKQTAPEATEKISYGMPTFFLNGNLVHFGDAKKHIGFYPTPSAVNAFNNELSDFKTSKGAIQFPINRDLPVELIKKIVLFRIEENTK